MAARERDRVAQMDAEVLRLRVQQRAKAQGHAVTGHGEHAQRLRERALGVRGVQREEAAHERERALVALARVPREEGHDMRHRRERRGEAAS